MNYKNFKYTHTHLTIFAIWRRKKNIVLNVVNELGFGLKRKTRRSYVFYFVLKYARNKLIWKIIKPKQWHKSSSLHRGGLKIKKFQAKKKNSWSQINQFHEKKSLANFHFLQFQKWPKINFWTWKKFKTAKNAISRKSFLIYLISRVFLPGLFLIFCPAVI